MKVRYSCGGAPESLGPPSLFCFRASAGAPRPAFNQKGYYDDDAALSTTWQGVHLQDMYRR